MQRFERTTQDEEAYGWYGLRLSKAENYYHSYLNAVLYLLMNLDKEFGYRLPKRLREAEQNGVVLSGFVKSFLDVVEEYDKELAKRQAIDEMQITCTDQSEESKLALPQIIDNKQLIEISQESDKYKKLDINNSLSNEANPKKWFFGEILEKLNEVFKSDQYSTYTEIFDKFWMKEQRQKISKRFFQQSKILERRDYDYTIKAGNVISKLK